VFEVLSKADILELNATLYAIPPTYQSRLTVCFIRHAFLDDDGAGQLRTTLPLSSIPFRASLVYF
jgi:hypothetical protein